MPLPLREFPIRIFSAEKISSMRRMRSSAFNSLTAFARQMPGSSPQRIGGVSQFPPFCMNMFDMLPSVTSPFSLRNKTS